MNQVFNNKVVVVYIDPLSSSLITESNTTNLSDFLAETIHRVNPYYYRKTLVLCDPNVHTWVYVDNEILRWFTSDDL